MIIFLNNNKIYTTNKIINQKKIVCICINDIITTQIILLPQNYSILTLNIYNKKILNILRHSCAHLMAHAIKNIYDNTILAFGPVVKNGFYYDFYIKKKITELDLKLIEKEMHSINKKSYHIIKYNLNLKNAKKFFKKNKYKFSILENIKQKYISCYKQGNFIDLCLGPHLKNTKFIKYFKLTKISGAYWKNNNKNEMLNRIYGTVWTTNKELNFFLQKNKDRTNKTFLNTNTNLFYFDDKSQGVIFWYKNGWILYRIIITYIRDNIFKKKFIEINTPSILNSYIFNKSGHMDKFNSFMFKFENNNTLDVLKPMNCPCHITIFNNFKKKSYRDLPYKLAEFGSCFRNELSGSLHNLMRLKNFTQDDGHIFCSISQINTEIIKFIDEVKNTYFNIGFKIYKVILSKRPTYIKKNNKIWNKAENILEKVLNKINIKYTTSNDGAFYGPKIEISLKDRLNRYWQCGTIQLDFFSSKRLNATYANKNGKIKYPIILHRAVLGSIERFLGITIENNNGIIPFNFTPIQFEIIYINNRYLNYTKKVYNILIKNYKVIINILNERLDYKIKKCILEKIPYIIIIGENEIKNKTISIRKIFSKNFKSLKINKLKRFAQKYKEIYY